MKRKLSRKTTGLLLNTSGFTLIELMIAITVSAIAMASVAVTYDHLQTSSIQQVEAGMIQQNLRGVLSIMERELRLTGQNFTQTPQMFGVSDVRSFTITQPGTAATPNGNGSQILRMTLDLNNDGQLGAGETVTYSLYDRDGDGQLFDLARSTTFPGVDLVSGRQLVAEGIEAIGFAFAFDNDSDEAIDRDATGNIIWAVDLDNDGLLESDLLNVGLGYTVQPGQIRAVQIWILARANRPDRKYVNTHQYSVGNRPLGPMNDSYRRWMLQEVLHCRNL